MRIVYLVEGIYPTSGGTPRVVAALHDEMKRRGHDVLVICPQGSSSEDTLPVRAFRVPPATEGAIWLSESERQRIANFRPDLVHSHNDRLAIYFGKRLSEQLKIPHVHTLHADYATLRPHYRSARVLSWVMSRHARRLSQNIAPLTSGADDRDLRTLHDLAASVDAAFTPARYVYEALKSSTRNLRYLPSGHDFAIRDARDFPSATKKKSIHLVTVSRVVIEKRIDVLIEALAQARQHADVELTIIGGGHHRDRFERLAKRLGVEKAVHFAGVISDRQQLMAAYDQFDAFVLASYHYETQGLVLLEAAARGLPIILCDERLVVGVNETNAILTGPEAGDIADGIVAYARLPMDTRQKMAQASLSAAREWPFEKTADAYERAYESLIRQKRSGRPGAPKRARRTPAQQSPRDVRR